MNRDQEVVERKAFVFIVTIYRIQFDTKYETRNFYMFSFRDVCSLAGIFRVLLPK
jgi:hypothetical protein